MDGKNLNEILNWRYATKRMTGKSLPDEIIERILDAIRLSASSLGFQPYTIFVISDPEIKSKIRPIANDQPQITECSHLLVFTAWTELTEEQMNRHMENTARERGIEVDSLKRWIDFLNNRNKQYSKEENIQWAGHQAYLALGTGLIAAASEGIDATPMEGFKPEELDALLKLHEKGLRSMVLMAIGYRDEANDYLLKQKKVRRPKEELFIRM
jgi:nitroreductase